MQGIIKQPLASPALPDLRNLGSILRILLAVNGATLLIALSREPRLAALAREWATLTSFVEPLGCHPRHAAPLVRIVKPLKRQRE